ncbi:GSCOCG00012173001-RA-CDS, partial [Cotesia congregata]
TELNDDQYIITKETSKLNIIDIKNTADNCADEIKNSIQANRQNNSTITNFSNENRAFYPSIDQDAPKIFHSFITTSILLKKAKNKTSSGTDNIPMIVLKNLPEQFIKDYTVIFNNAINRTYYPKRWKVAKVIPIRKKNKDPSEPGSYRPISLT